jgi:hypothetical protein
MPGFNSHLRASTKLAKPNSEKLLNQPAQFRSIQKLALSRFHGNVAFDGCFLAFLPFFNTMIACVTKRHLLILM